MFYPSINQLEETILWHQQQIEEQKAELDRVKMSAAFAEDAASKVEDALEHIDPKYLDVFRGHLLSLFPTEKPVYLEEKVETNDYVDKINSHPIPKDKEKKEFGHLSYYELTGKPDTRPDTYEDIALNITYSSSGRAHVGFNDLTEAEEFREHLEMPSMLDKAVIMNNHKWEVKFYCDRSYIDELLEVFNQIHNDDFEQDEDWTPEQKEELDWQEQLVRIAPDIFYDPSTSKCFVGFSNYQRANTYGAHLKEIHELYDSRYTVDKPKVVTNCKHELVIECIKEENARKLAPLILKKELDHKRNKAITDTWISPLEKEETKEEPPSPLHAPLLASPKTAQESATQEEQLDFPSPPYKPIPLDQVELCDVVTTSPNSQSAYEVREHKGGYIVTTCLHNVPLPNRVGEDFTFSDKVYLVEKGDNSILLATHSVHRSAS